jgi:hypothetical protein
MTRAQSRRLAALAALYAEIGSGRAPASARRDRPGVAPRLLFALCIRSRQRYTALRRAGVRIAVARRHIRDEFDLAPLALGFVTLGADAPARTDAGGIDAAA